jgi:hypothetical protein
MKIQLNRKGRVSLPLFTATLALAITFTLSCSSNDDDPTPPGGGDGQLAGNAEYERVKERNKYYDPDNANERCEKGVVQFSCSLPDGDVWYSELEKYCKKIMGSSMTPTYELETVKWEVCGGLLCNTSWGCRCNGGAYEEKCGEGWYNSNTQYCGYDYDMATMTTTYEVKAKLPCGTDFYKPSDNPLYAYERCENNVVEYRCGMSDWYNPKTNACNGKTGDIVPKAEATCNGKEIDDFGYKMCKDGVIKQECGSMSGGEPVWYNNITESCDYMTRTVKPKTKCG